MPLPPLRVYLDTSIFGGYFDPEFQVVTRELWQRLTDGRLIPVVGEQTLSELAMAPPDVQALLAQLPQDHEPLAVTPEAIALARAYIDAAAVPSKWQGDALHVATAAVHGVGILLSWNFRHMANVRRNRAFNAVNLMQGYPQVDIRSPKEVIYDDRTAD